MITAYLFLPRIKTKSFKLSMQDLQLHFIPTRFDDHGRNVNVI